MSYLNKECRYFPAPVMMQKLPRASWLEHNEDPSMILHC